MIYIYKSAAVIMIGLCLAKLGVQSTHMFAQSLGRMPMTREDRTMQIATRHGKDCYEPTNEQRWTQCRIYSDLNIGGLRCNAEDSI